MPTAAKDTIREAATVLLVREHAGRRELYWVRRSHEVSFSGGFYAFPGGRIDDADSALAAKLGLDSTDGPRRVAALRELFEETGVLLARGTWDRDTFDANRKALLGDLITFEAALGALGATLDPDALALAGRWLTPPFVPKRFDTFFYAAPMPASQEPVVWPGELASGEWITPDEALARWSKGRALLHPPALHMIRSLRENGLTRALPAMNAPPHVIDLVAQRIEFQAGIHLVPLRTPTLPPATHTNCYFVGEEEMVIVDPASPYEDEQQRLAALCDGFLAEGRKFREILLTHEHHDHVGGVEVLRRKLGIPVRAHVGTIERLEGTVAVDREIAADEIISLPGGLRLRALYTPGHARGHLCFFEETTGALLAGDMIAGIGSIVVIPPDGDMIDYMASLRLMRSLPVNALYPAHGPTLPDGPRKIDEYIAHREQREAQIVAGLQASGGGTPEELVPHVYTDVPKAMYPLAAHSMLAVLEKLVKEGRASQADDRYTPKS